MTRFGESGERGEERLAELLALAAGEAQGDGDAHHAAWGARRRARRHRAVQVAIGAATAVAVTGGALAITQGVTGAGPSRPATAGPPTHLAGVLTSFDACGDYLDYVKGHALGEVGPYGLGQPTQMVFGSRGFEAPSMPLYAAGALASGAPTPMSEAEGTYSTTDDQVAGVDEPDTFKTNGHVVLTLTGPTLRVLDTAGHVTGSLTLPGDTGGGMLLAGNRVVVLSSPDAAGSTPYGGPMATYGMGMPPTTGEQARAAVVDISDPAHPELVRTFLLDGTVVAARLVDGQVRLVDRVDGPRLSFTTPSQTESTDAATAANRALVTASTVADWLPAWQVAQPDGATSPRQPLAACDAIARPKQANGIATVTVATLDPTAATLGAGSGVVAAGQTVYATATHLYIAGQATPPGASGATSYGCCTVIPPAGSTTELYVFSTPGIGPPVFTASGQVPGWLLNSYALDDDGADVRVVTTEASASGSTDTRITVLRETDSQLTPVGAVGGLGAGEAVRAVRFNGTQAYVVTYRSFDPLYVVDLADPAHPTVAGELDQPGFSEFLYPLPGGRLFGVGVTITGNEPNGLVAALYDVSDPAHPTRLADAPLSSGFALPSFDPHTFAYWAPDDLALLAVGQGAASALDVGTTTLTQSAILGHGADTAQRAAVVDGAVWVVMGDGVVITPLNDLGASTWHAYAG